MESPHRPSPLATHSRWLVLLGSGFALAAAITALVRYGRFRRPSSTPTSASAGSLTAFDQSLSLSVPTRTEPSPTKPAPSFRPKSFAAAFLLAAVSFVILQNTVPQIAGGLFVVLVTGSILYGVETSTRITRRTFRAGKHAAITTVEVMQLIVARLPIPRDHRAPLAAFGALVLMVISVVFFQISAIGDPLVDATLWMALAGTAVMGISVLSTREESGWSRAARAVTTHSNRWLLGGGIIILLILCESNLQRFPVFASVPTHVQFLLLCGGIILVTMGAGGLRLLPPLGRAVVRFVRPSVAPSADMSMMSSRTRLLVSHYSLLLAILLVAFGLRFWQLNDTNRIFTDELNHVSAILDLMRAPNTPILVPFSGIAAFPYLFPYGQKFGVDIFGRNFIGFRAFSAVLGTLTVAATYRLGRALFDRQTALIAALLLATFPPHLHFSRLGLNNIADPFFGTLALAFLAQGVRHNRRMDWALGGAMLGLTHYFYEAGRLLFTPLAILWLLGLLLLDYAGRRATAAPKSASIRSIPTGLLPISMRDIRGWGSFVTRQQNWRAAILTAVLVAAPVYYTLLGMNRPLTARLVNNQIGLTGAYWHDLLMSGQFQQHITQHVVPAFAVYVNMHDVTLFYGGETPLLLAAVAPFFLLGLAYAVWRWRTPGALLLLLWIVSTSLGNTLVVQSSAYTRFVLVFPALMLTVAFGLRQALPLIFPARRQGRWLVIGIGALAIGLAAVQANYYFNDHIHTLNAEGRANWAHPDAEDAILRSISFPTGTGIHLVSSVPADANYNNAILHFMRPDLSLDTLSAVQLTRDYFRQLRCGVDHAFFLVLNDWNALWQVRQAFYLQEGQLSPYKDIPFTAQYVLYYAPYWPGNDHPFRNRCDRSP